MEFNKNQKLLSIADSVKRKESFTSDKFFMKKYRYVIQNNEYRRIFKSPTTLYEYMWSRIIRGKMKNDIYDIYNKYYKKGFLASTISLRELSKKCYMHTHTIAKYTDLWEKKGVIKRDKAPTGVKGQYQYIYILGTWQYIEGVRLERLYMEDEFE